MRLEALLHRRLTALLFLTTLLVLGTGLAGCDSGAQPVTAGPRHVTLELGTQGDSMVFDRTELRAPAGALITVIFHNRSRLVAVEHNWLLARPGAEESVTAAALVAGGDNDFVAPNDSNVIAATKLAPRGESRSVTFPAPPAGVYPYLCAFPGHHMVMKGSLIITP